MRKVRSGFICSLLVLGFYSVNASALELHDALNEFGAKLHDKLDAKISKDVRDFEWDKYGHSTKVMNIEGIGNVTYSLMKNWGDEKSFHSYVIKSDKFNIYFPGRDYAIQEVKIPDLKLEVTIYGDRSGTFVKKDGWEYTNSGVAVLGSGSSSDAGLDKLWIRYYKNFFVYSGINSGQPIEGIGQKYLNIWSELNGKKHFLCSYPKNHEQLTQICEKLEIIPNISWKDTSTTVIEWLEKNVLAFL